MKDRYELFEASQDMLICELDKIVQKHEMTPQILSVIDTLVDVIKDLDEIMDNEEARSEDAYSQRNSRYYSRGSSYRSGSYYKDDYPYSKNSIKMTSGKSGRSDSVTQMLNHLTLAMDSASTEEERRRIQKMIDEIENQK